MIEYIIHNCNWITKKKKKKKKTVINKEYSDLSDKMSIKSQQWHFEKITDPGRGHLYPKVDMMLVQYTDPQNRH